MHPMYNKRASLFQSKSFADILFSALNGRLCQKNVCKDCWNGKPQPSILSRRKYESISISKSIN